MNSPGDANLMIEARSALLDACDALQHQLAAIVLVGAQAIYLHTGAADVALAEMTKDSDIALDARLLSADPRIDEAMRAAGFTLDPVNPQPGAWRNAKGVPVDLMVPEALAGPGGSRRGVNIPPHDKRAARRTVGLEAAVVDHRPMEVSVEDDDRRHTINVAGPAALLVAKLHKLGERQNYPHRLNDKDAHDVYRLFAAVSTPQLADSIRGLRADPLSDDVTREALRLLAELFAAGADAQGCVMAGQAERLVGDPDFVAAAVSALAKDLLLALRDA